MSALSFNSLAPFAKTGVSAAQLSQQMIHDQFYEALEKVNLEVQKRCDVSAIFIEHAPKEPASTYVDPTRNLLLGIAHEGASEPISILDLKALDGSIKTVEDLVLEISFKVEQHLTAKKTAGILFSASGSKFDTRKLDEKWQAAIDQQGYFTINDNRLVYTVPDGRFLPIKADRLASYTQFRLVFEEPNKIRLFDDYDFIRPDHRGMLINVEKIHQIAVSQLVKGFEEDAKSYKGDYYLLERDTLTDPKKEHLYGVLCFF